MDASLPAVDVVIGNFNGERYLRECLESLRAQTLQPDAVLVIDAGSTDGSAEAAAASGAKVVSAENRGLGYLYNRGVENASAPYVFVANNYVALAADCLEQLVRALGDHSDAFAADPRQDSGDGRSLVHARTTIRRGPLLRQPIPGFRLDLRAPATTVAETACTNAGAMLVRRSMYLELGGFDESFFLDFEDLDLCWRAWARGWPSLHVPGASVRHHVGISHGGRRRLLARRYAKSHHNLARWALKCLPWRDAATVLTGELLRFPRHPIVVGRGLVALLPELREVLGERRSIKNRGSVLESLLALSRDGMQR
jgi:GT2 family glycosyltransferase